MVRRRQLKRSLLCRGRQLKNVVSFLGKKATPSAAAPGDTNPSDTIEQKLLKTKRLLVLTYGLEQVCSLSKAQIRLLDYVFLPITGKSLTLNRTKMSVFVWMCLTAMISIAVGKAKAEVC